MKYKKPIVKDLSQISIAIGATCIGGAQVNKSCEPNGNFAGFFCSTGVSFETGTNCHPTGSGHIG